MRTAEDRGGDKLNTCLATSKQWTGLKFQQILRTTEDRGIDKLKICGLTKNIKQWTILNW